MSLHTELTGKSHAKSENACISMAKLLADFASVNDPDTRLHGRIEKILAIQWLMSGFRRHRRV